MEVPKSEALTEYRYAAFVSFRHVEPDRCWAWRSCFLQISKARERVSRTARAANLHQWGIALANYITVNRALPQSETGYGDYYPFEAEITDMNPSQDDY